MALLLVLIGFIGIAAGLAWYLIAHDHGEKEPIGALWLAAGFGILGVFLAIFLEQLLPAQDLVAGAPLKVLFLATLGVGVIEEGCKFLPLSLWLYPKRYFNEHTDGIIYFAVAGMAFGVPENIGYSLAYGAKAGIGRIILTPIFHAATGAIVGYYLAKSKLDHHSRRLFWPALAGAIVLHAIYDFGLFSGVAMLNIVSVVITIVVSIGLFYLYSKATRLDQQAGLSVVGSNNFCRSCGTPNAKHNLYCAHCGMRA